MIPTHPAIGQPFRRKEDLRFLTGDGCYGDDRAFPAALVAVVVRAPYAHATLESIDVTSVAEMPGVRAVLTGDDIAGEVEPIPSFNRTEPFRILNRDGSEIPEANQPVLATGKVRYLGEPVALVVADSAGEARDAAEALLVEYTPLAPLMELDDALRDGAPQIWDDVPDNQTFDWESGDAAATDEAFACAHHVTRVRVRNNRLAPVFLEPRTAAAEYHTDGGHVTLHTGSQSAHGMKATLCNMLSLAPGELQVVTPDMGGGFGARGPVYPEMALVVLAARRLKRTVKWVADRSESFLSDTQSRDHVLGGELAIDAQGRFTALRVDVQWRHGAYLAGRMVAVIVRFLVPTLGGVYAIANGHVRLRGIVTNTTPQAAIRGIGRVEATYLMELLVDTAARELAMDPIALRRANLVRDEHLPWFSVGGARYEACTFEPHMERALELADWSGFAARRARSRDAGKLRGIGCAVYVENDGGAPSEYARLHVHGDARVDLAIGTQNFGMGHETAFAQIVMDALDVPFESVHHIDGDTRAVARGSGSHGSRSMRVGGTAIVLAARTLLENAVPMAAEMLQTTPDLVHFSGGAYRAGDGGPQVGLFEVAAFASERGESLAAEADFTQARESFSSGCHVCEVELDADTGVATLVQHVIITDAGRVVNPLLVDGQVHGGATQGLGQAAMEEVRYDPESGQTLTGSLMDYALPRADDLPFFTTESAETRETDNPLGIKGVGEGPTTGAPAAYMNAISDALAWIDAAPVDMPATSEKLWRAMRQRTHS